MCPEQEKVGFISLTWGGATCLEPCLALSLARAAGTQVLVQAGLHGVAEKWFNLLPNRILFSHIVITRYLPPKWIT